ncbi:MAG: DUF1800 domain-containing protein [Planctomycetota bacterium]|nr:DUF1800 domain-containing protein [Planctomycetota bacterium]MDP6761240.1 DUF1800 domain-containing protein [Planctomycetota bacterium]MDP6988380.1 DUF1800 domain-containing protein [Planctomycetota bacterium]
MSTEGRSERLRWARVLVAAVAMGAGAAPAALGGWADDPVTQTGAVAWNASNAEHLFNRAAFGVTPEELDDILEHTPEHVVDELLSPRESAGEPFFAERGDASQYRQMRGLPEEERRRFRAQLRAADRRQMDDYASFWVDQMVDYEDPLRDRITLFWHGFFTTSSRDVRRSFEVIQQHQFLRANALGSYADLLRGIVRDPAMLYYLDNNANRKGKPNENLARELMELFSLGEGNYSEADVKEVARALTGYSANRDGEFEFNRRQHDGGIKRVLGERGRFDGDDVVEVLLEQEACAEWVAGRLIEFLEGVQPESARLREYAGILRNEDYQLRPFLRRLFLDPEFYREEVVGTRVQSPVDYLVGMTRRLDVHPPARYLLLAAGNLGERLFQPPNVKGWEGGESWITTSSLLQRGNVAGLVLGTIDLQAAFEGNPGLGERRRELRRRLSDARRSGAESDAGPQGDDMDMDMDLDMDMEIDSEMDMDMEMGAEAPPTSDSGGDAVPRALRALRSAVGSGYRPRLNLTWRVKATGATDDGEILDELLSSLLAIEAPAETRALLLDHLKAERAGIGIREGELLEATAACEAILRRLAHLILSLPEAQLG